MFGFTRKRREARSSVWREVYADKDREEKRKEANNGFQRKKGSKMGKMRRPKYKRSFAYDVW